MLQGLSSLDEPSRSPAFRWNVGRLLFECTSVRGSLSGHLPTRSMMGPSSMAWGDLKRRGPRRIPSCTGQHPWHPARLHKTLQKQATCRKSYFVIVCPGCIQPCTEQVEPSSQNLIHKRSFRFAAGRQQQWQRGPWALLRTRAVLRRKRDQRLPLASLACLAPFLSGGPPRPQCVAPPRAPSTPSPSLKTAGSARDTPVHTLSAQCVFQGATRRAESPTLTAREPCLRQGRASGRREPSPRSYQKGRSAAVSFPHVCELH